MWRHRWCKYQSRCLHRLDCLRNCRFELYIFIYIYILCKWKIFIFDFYSRFHVLHHRIRRFDRFDSIRRVTTTDSQFRFVNFVDEAICTFFLFFFNKQILRRKIRQIRRKKCIFIFVITKRIGIRQKFRRASSLETTNDFYGEKSKIEFNQFFIPNNIIYISFAICYDALFNFYHFVSFLQDFPSLSPSASYPPLRPPLHLFR